MKNLKINHSDKTASLVGSKDFGGIRSYFFRSEFADGCILAFYSDSPWGRCHDMEKGWVVINPSKKIIVEECETRSMGMATGEYKDWIKSVRATHGKTKKVFRYENGDLLWKMEE